MINLDQNKDQDIDQNHNGLLLYMSMAQCKITVTTLLTHWDTAVLH